MRAKWLTPLLTLALTALLVGDPTLAWSERSETPSSQLEDFCFPPGYLAQNILVPALRGPMNIAINSKDEIVVTNELADRILRVNSDGSISEYATAVSGHHRGIAFDSDDNL